MQSVTLHPSASAQGSPDPAREAVRLDRKIVKTRNRLAHLS
jgi:hypothetical protein